MANEVFANGLEVACKAADGVSSAAFPDVCFTPKEPVPFANTAYAKDTTNGSKTVFISGKEVVLKDYSYLKVSSGDTGARGRKGFSTGAKNGKAYFRSWSMNVKIEGYNVCRHTDSMTHNHNPTQGNTGEWKYLDTADRKKCADDKKRVDEACKVDKKEQKKFEKRQKKANKRRIKHGKSPKKIRKKTWKDKHCKSMLFKPDPTHWSKNMQEIADNAEQTITDLKKQALEKGWDIVKDAASGYGKRTAEKHAAALGCIALSPIAEAICQAAMVVVDAVDGAITIASTGAEIYQNASELNHAIEVLESTKERYTKITDIINMPDGKEKKEKLDKLRKDYLDEMAEAAKNDPCLSARKCMLVPYTTKQGNLAKGEVKEGDYGAGLLAGKFGLGDSRGCCPGQTGHHLIPDSWLQGKCSNGYTKGGAPVVCMEGTTHTGGTHGEIHTGLNLAYERSLYARVEKGTEHNMYNINDIMDMAVDSHKEVMNIDWPGFNLFSGDGCDRACLKAQLSSYYNGKGCKGIEPTKIGKEVEENDDSSL